MLELNKIYNMDCMEGMKRLPDESIDLIITSPPYNLGKQHHTGNNRFKGYNKYHDDMPEELYQHWQIEVLNECHRVLKNNGSMWYNHKNRIRNGIQITPYEWILKSNFLVKQEVVWQNGSQNFDKIRFYPMTERVYWMVKNSKTKMFNSINHHDIFTRAEWQPVKTKGEFKRAFPEQMVRDIISCFENAGVVLDMYSGSGTTGKVAIEMGRTFLGFELDKKYCDLANKRISEEMAQIKLF